MVWICKKFIIFRILFDFEEFSWFVFLVVRLGFVSCLVGLNLFIIVFLVNGY